MKIKGVIEDLKILKIKIKNDHKNSKNISRTFSGVVVGSVGFSLLWSFLTVGGVVRVACQGFLVRKFVSVFWWVELDFFSLECNEMSSNEL